MLDYAIKDSSGNWHITVTSKTDVAEVKVDAQNDAISSYPGWVEIRIYPHYIDKAVPNTNEFDWEW